MELRSREKPDIKIQVNSKKNKILLTKGFIVITKGSHYGSDRLSQDILEYNYIIPKNVIIG